MSSVGGKRTIRNVKGRMRLRLGLLSAYLIGGCTTVDGEQTVSPFPYGCDDLVAVGRVVTTTETSIAEGGDLSNWHSRRQLRVRIKRVLYGSETRRVVPARAISHARIRDDRDFLVVLSPVDAEYEVQTAVLWSEKPRPVLAQTCSEVR